jgi:dTDP-4-amino-4,6-dideoxy-D-galactose acyltransferase
MDVEIADLWEAAAVHHRIAHALIVTKGRTIIMACIRPFANSVEEIRSALQSHLPWSPLDFIRGISPEGDKQVYLDTLCRKLELSNDLRFVYDDPAEGPLAVMAERLAWDSSFFGYGIAKLYGINHLSAPGYRPFADLNAPVRAFLEKAKEAGIRYIFTQVDPRDLALMRALGEQGFCLIEPRLYFHRGIRDYEYIKRYPTREAREEDLPFITAVARDTVNIYDRFHADPFINKCDADRLMEQWIRASLSKEFSDLVMVPDLAGEPAAVVTGRFLKKDWPLWNLHISQVVLGASSGQIQGWAVKLLSELIYRFAEGGTEHLYFSTQATNTRVIKVCEHLGLHLGKTEFVFRKTL